MSFGIATCLCRLRRGQHHQPVTKAGLKCTDGRTIMPEAFKHMDGVTVPLVWQHGHKDPKNVLGHAILESRDDGVYGYGYFNGTEQGKNAKALVEHEDIKALSIYANKLVERSKQVFHGMIREVSLALAGANPGAFIDNITIAHSDGDYETLEDEAIIHTGLPLEHEEGPGQATKDVVEHATVQEVYDSLSQEQKDLLNYMVGTALEEASAKHSEESEESSDDNNTGNSADNTEGDLDHQEGSTEMTRNVFEQNGGGQSGESEGTTLTHADMQSIIQDAIKGGSLKEAVDSYALAHGIEDIDVLFPEARSLTSTPEWNKRRTEWVAGVLGNTRKSPFSRVKSIIADITMESARALGYIKGTLK